MTIPTLQLPRAGAFLHRLIAGLLAVGVPVTALAHPGHHGSDWLQAVMHLLTEPDHLGMILLAIVAAAWGVRQLRRRNQRDRASSDR